MTDDKDDYLLTTHSAPNKNADPTGFDAPEEGYEVVEVVRSRNHELTVVWGREENPLSLERNPARVEKGRPDPDPDTCQDTKADGAPCTREVDDGERYCWQHGGE